MTVQDLRPDFQETSAFYLGNIYDVLADPNVTRASPVAKPPPFSRPRYAIWENSLLFLSLVMSLSCALLATLLQQWARRYIRLTQLARTSPEGRAQTRAFYADGVDKMHIQWAVEGLPTLLHLSLFLFFGGLAVFLFNVDVELFTCVVCWIGLFLIVYGLITLLPLIRSDSPYYTPLSKPVWFLKASIQFVAALVLHSIFFVFPSIHQIRLVEFSLTVRWIFRGMEKEAEELAKKQSLDIVRILGWTARALGDDNSRGMFFEAIPGLLSSELVKNFEKVPQTLLFEFWRTVDTFIMYTRTSKSVPKEVESRLVDIGMDIASMIPCSGYSYVDFISNPKPVSFDRPELMTRWIDHKSPFVSCAARVRAADMLGRMEERDRSWFELACRVSRLSEPELRIDLAHARDNMVLAIVIDTCHNTLLFPYNKFSKGMGGFISGFVKIDIRRTLPWLQYDFCQLWNKLVQEARKPKSRDLATYRILDEIAGHYESLHRGTDCALPPNNVYLSPSSFPLCDIPSRHLIPGNSPDPLPHHSTSSGSGPIIPELYRPAATDSHKTDASPPSAVATALQDTSPVDMVSYILRGSAHCVAADAASSIPLLPTSYVINLSITAAPSPSHVPPLPDAGSLAFLSNTKRSHSTGHTTLSRPRARGLVNTGGVYFSNAVLQLLVHSPPFWDVFRELENLKGQPGERGPETATPLVDATMKFFEEFMFKEKKPLLTQRPPQQAVREISREDEEEKEEHNNLDLFELTYMYDAMKEKTQLKGFLVRSRCQDVPFYH